jgi:glutathione synthase/RimK-type ligase-like ATP-grasp enzyme
MEKTTNLDVLVVYSSKLAASATGRDLRATSPFPAHRGRSNYNQSYTYFLTKCHEQGLTAGFSTSKNIIGAGTCNSYWSHTKEGWSRHRTSCYSSNIFDKLSPTSLANITNRDLLFSSSSIRPFNNQTLCELFADKFQTYQRFPTYSVPTVALTDSSYSGIKRALKSMALLIKHHSHASDFEPAIFLKNRYGAGGYGIYKIDKDYAKTIYHLTSRRRSMSYVIQPAIRYDQGFVYQGKPALTDIRLIFHNNRIIQSYIRIAKPNSYLCNEHQGGELIYLDLASIPTSVVRVAKEISNELNKPHSLYALDFVISNSGHIFLLEGNNGPGIDWNSQNLRNEQMSKQLIATIVQELARRVQSDTDIRQEDFNSYQIGDSLVNLISE